MCLCWQHALSAKADAADADAEARVLFDAGVGASGAERWVVARDYLRRSAALKPKAATLLNLAVAEVKLGMRSASLATLDAFDRTADTLEHADMIERAQALRMIALKLPPDSGIEAAMERPESSGLSSAPAPAQEASKQPSGPQLPKLTAEVSATPATPASPVAAVSRGSLFAARSLIVGGVALAAATVPLSLWAIARADALARCEKGSRTCDNHSEIQRQSRGAWSAAILSGGLALGLLAGGSTWLIRLKRSPVSPTASATKTHWNVGLLGTF